jgi:hypothetical protein
VSPSNPRTTESGLQTCSNADFFNDIRPKLPFDGELSDDRF